MKQKCRVNFSIFPRESGKIIHCGLCKKMHRQKKDSDFIIWRGLIWISILVVCRKLCVQSVDVRPSLCFLLVFNDFGKPEFGSMLGNRETNGKFEEIRTRWHQTKGPNHDHFCLVDLCPLCISPDPGFQVRLFIAISGFESWPKSAGLPWKVLENQLTVS